MAVLQRLSLIIWVETLLSFGLNFGISNCRQTAVTSES